MSPEPDLVATERCTASAGERSCAGIAKCGSELVGLAERFYVSLWTGALALVTLSALAALVLLPVRGLPPGAPVTPAIAGTSLLLVLLLLALRQRRTLYLLLRSHTKLELVPVCVAAALVAQPELAGELWWPSCALLMALAILAPPRRTMAYAAIVLAANLAGHLVADDLDDAQPVAIIGLWIGYPTWLGIVAVLSERLTAHLLQLNTAAAAPQRQAPRRVPAWTTQEHKVPRSTSGGHTPGTSDDHGNGAPGANAAGPHVAERLTARQLEVVLLLADGMRHREIAECLSISERQVQRHVAQAVARLDVRNSYELVALAVRDCVAPTASQGRRPGKPGLATS